MQNISIQLAEFKHLEALAYLFDAYRVFYRKDSDIKAATSFLKSRLTLKDSIIFVAEDSPSNLLGFVQLYPLFSSTRMQKMWLLNDLYVKPAERGKGISKHLIDRCKQWTVATQACGLSLETEKQNRIGNRLYPSMNFELDTEHNFYFWENK